MFEFLRKAAFLAFVLSMFGGIANPLSAQELNERALTGAAFQAADQAFKAIERDRPQEAVAPARRARELAPSSEIAARLLIDALARAGDRDGALRVAHQAIAQGGGSGQIYAQRAFLRQQLGNPQGAEADFRIALERGGLASGQRETIENTLRELRFSIALTSAQILEREGSREAAAATLLSFLETDRRLAAAWFELGYLYLRGNERAKAAEAFDGGLALEERPEVFLQAGFAHTGINNVKASRYLRRALDAWDEDPSLSARTEREREEARNQVAEADRSIRTILSLSGTEARTLSEGGRKIEGGAEVSVLFDGRYLPSVRGLEVFTRGNVSREQTGFEEAVGNIGLRWQPLDGVNFRVSGEFSQRLRPSSLSQFIGSWGYSMGGMGYPYEEAFSPYFAASTFGSWRSGEKRYLQDASFSLGMSYAGRVPLRYMAGFEISGLASYDSAAAKRAAFGIGPALNLRTWVGGNRHRSYDAILSLRIGYYVPVGDSRRQEGLQGRMSVEF